MKCFNEVFVPSGWIITTNEVPQNLSRTAWPQVQETSENVFDLTILTNTKNDDDTINETHQLILNFIYGNNEISLVQESGLMRRKSIVDDEVETGGKEFTYLLKVIDHATNSVMYYDVKLARVEVEKKEKTIEDDTLSEHLEVITVYDEDEEDPFNIDFEDTKD